MELGGQADCRIAVVTAHILLRRIGDYLRADGTDDAGLWEKLSLRRDGSVKNTTAPAHCRGEQATGGQIGRRQ
jgi:hypothetical protein